MDLLELEKLPPTPALLPRLHPLLTHEALPIVAQPLPPPDPPLLQQR